MPKLQNKLNPIYSSILLGIFWSCWHLPLFFIRGTGHYGFPFILFVIQDIFLSIIFTWVYNRTHGSLIFPILLHASVNVTNSLLSYSSLSYLTKSWNKYTIIAAIIQIIFFFLIIMDMIRKPTGKSTIKNITNL